MSHYKHWLQSALQNTNDTQGDNPTIGLISRVKATTTNTNVKMKTLNKH